MEKNISKKDLKIIDRENNKDESNITMLYILNIKNNMTVMKPYIKKMLPYLTKILNDYNLEFFEESSKIGIENILVSLKKYLVLFMTTESPIIREKTVQVIINICSNFITVESKISYSSTNINYIDNFLNTKLGYFTFIILLTSIQFTDIDVKSYVNVGIFNLIDLLYSFEKGGVYSISYLLILSSSLNLLLNSINYDNKYTNVFTSIKYLNLMLTYTIVINQLICWCWNVTLDIETRTEKIISEYITDSSSSYYLYNINNYIQKQFNIQNIKLTKEMLPEFIIKRSEYLLKINNIKYSKYSIDIDKIDKEDTITDYNICKDNNLKLCKDIIEKNEININESKLNRDKESIKQINEIDPNIKLDKFYSDFIFGLQKTSIEDKTLLKDIQNDLQILSDTIQTYEEYLTLSDGYPLETTLNMYKSTVLLNPNYKNILSKLNDTGRNLFAEQIIKKQLTIRKFFQENKTIIEKYTGKTIENIYKESFVEIQNNIDTYTNVITDFDITNNIQNSYINFLKDIGTLTGYKNFQDSLLSPIFPSFNSSIYYTKEIAPNFLNFLTNILITNPTEVDKINSIDIDNLISKKLDQYPIDSNDLFKNIFDASNTNTISDLINLSKLSYQIGYNVFKRYTTGVEAYSNIEVREKYFELVVNEHYKGNHPVKNFITNNLILLCNDTENLTSLKNSDASSGYFCKDEFDIIIKNTDRIEESCEPLLQLSFCKNPTTFQYVKDELTNINTNVLKLQSEPDLFDFKKEVSLQSVSNVMFFIFIIFILKNLFSPVLKKIKQENLLTFEEIIKKIDKYEDK
jgi:hypothetical protein